MATDYLFDRIRKLFSPPDAVTSEDLRNLIVRLFANLDQSAKAVIYHLYLLLAAWLASVAIAYGFVSEGGVGPFKLASVKLLLVALPAVIGLQYYLIATALSWNGLIRAALSQIYKRHLPKIHELTFLLESPSFVTLEAFMHEPRNSGQNAHDTQLHRVLLHGNHRYL